MRVRICVHVYSECADIMTGGSRRCIVVSTLAEACFYADHGFDDILYAYSLPFDKVVLTHTPRRFVLHVHPLVMWHCHTGKVTKSSYKLNMHSKILLIFECDLNIQYCPTLGVFHKIL